MAQRSIRIGVTGKIGSGKSTLLRMMESRGIATVNSDELARALMEDDTALREKVTNLLGTGAYIGGKLDRQFVASRIFSDSNLLKKLEAIVHPAVTEEIEEIFRQSGPGKPVAVESALILQTDFLKHFDYIILIDASDDTVIQRVSSAGRISEEDVRNRLAEQHWDDPSLTEEVDFTIENTGTPAIFEDRCKAILALLDVLSTRPLPEEPLHSGQADPA